ncbi:MAG: FtsW/RodA/SpoVE family cell cycle protein [Xanthomonadales bacterium]
MRRWLPGWLHWPQLDVPLLAGLLLLMGCGLLVLYSASGADADVVNRQAVRLAVGLAAMLVLSQVPPHILKIWTPWLFTLGLALLLATWFVGTGRATNRWLDLGLVRFQPSEITAVLIARQPDLGTALLVGVSGFFALFLAGLRWRLMFALAGLAVALLPALWYAMHDYQRQRVLTFLDPESDPLGTGWNIIQSKIAVGSGGLFGKGWLHGTQSRLEFIPERHTDFILAVLSEEFGLAGVLVLFAIYLFITGRGLYIASNARSTYARLLAGSLSLTFFVYVLVNAGMVSGLLPVVGVPLPLISYGGTSIVTLLAGFGILMSIHGHRTFIR